MVCGGQFNVSCELLLAIDRATCAGRQLECVCIIIIIIRARIVRLGNFIKLLLLLQTAEAVAVEMNDTNDLYFFFILCSLSGRQFYTVVKIVDDEGRSWYRDALRISTLIGSF